jgi:hypothetical protein
MSQGSLWQTGGLVCQALRGVAKATIRRVPRTSHVGDPARTEQGEAESGRWRDELREAEWAD